MATRTRAILATSMFTVVAAALSVRTPTAWSSEASQNPASESVITSIAAMAVAMPVPDDEYTANGQGSFRIGGDKAQPVTKAHVEIDERDRATLTLSLRDGTTLEIKGRAAGTGHHRTLTFRRGLGQDEISGSGEFSINDNTGKLTSASGNGRVKGDNFSFDFEAGRPAAGDPDTEDRHSFSDNVSGNGRLDAEGEKYRLTHMRINMARNGDLTIVVESPDTDDIHWEGRWSGDGPVYQVAFSRTGVRKVTATGAITLSRNKKAFKSIEVDGLAHGDFARLYFEARN